MKRIIRILGLVLTASALASAQIAIIAHPSVEEYTIDRPALVKIYTLSMLKWKNDAPITVFDLKAENPVRAKLLDYIDKEQLELRRIWLKAVASGGANAPEALLSEDEMVRRVASTPGAVGYVSTAKVSKGVKVLMRFGK